MQILIFAIISMISYLQACEIFQRDTINFSTSTKERLFFSYRNDGGKNIVPFFKATNCSGISSGNKYLMISLGPQNQELSDRVRAFDIANRYRDSGCFIQNSPFKVTEDFSSRKKYLEEKWRAIKSCYEVVVSELGSDVLEYPEKQPGCQYQVLAKNKLSFNGGFCFFKPSEKSDLSVELNLKEECLDYEGLKRLNIKVTDFQTVLNFYSAKDPTGESIELNSLASFPIRFSVSPNENIISTSETFTDLSPEFPGNYYLPDTHLGTPEAESSRPGFVRIRLPMWADNKCQSDCNNGFCQGLCDYAQPLVGNIRFFDITDQKTIELDSSWFQGGVVLPRYQGEISGRMFEIKDDFFKVGRTYRLSMSFNDPKFDFDALRNEYRSKLRVNRESLGSITPTGIPLIPEIRQINTTIPIPDMVEINNINFGKNLNDSFEAMLNTFSGHFRFSYWPPHFKKICGPKGCLPINDNYLSLTQEFKVISYNQETKKFSFQVLSLKRASPLLDGYEKNDPLMPKIFCKR